MNIITLICSILGGIAVLCTGLWFLISKAAQDGAKRAKLEIFEKKLLELDGSLSKTATVLSAINLSHSKLECVKDKDYADTVRESVKISKSNNEILKDISTWIMKRDNEMIGELARKFSPRKLTTVGEMVFAESCAKQVLTENIEFFVAELDKIAPKTKYDVEHEASTVLYANLSCDFFTPIKSFLYESPERKEYTDPDSGRTIPVDFSMALVLSLMSLKLRDEYLILHPEIK